MKIIRIIKRVLSIAICYLFRHKYILKKRITSYVREIKCTRCKQEFAMNDHTQSVLPLDDELKELHNMLRCNQDVTKCL